MDVEAHPPQYQSRFCLEYEGARENLLGSLATLRRPQFCLKISISFLLILQNKQKVEKDLAMEQSMVGNSCQLCPEVKIKLEPLEIYCTKCDDCISRYKAYYTMGSGDVRPILCLKCYRKALGDYIYVHDSAFPKAGFEKKKNDEENEEPWVMCSKCQAWQHQICALYNGQTHGGAEADYTCPSCYIKAIEKKDHKSLRQSAIRCAKDLPRTNLSYYIENRLSTQLEQERRDRAKHSGRRFDEVPGAKDIVVRVVSSVEKKLEVKPNFLEIFQELNYPTEFPYQSKVILLFQKIDGVEVCLFCMYVQEFGPECQFPNQRRVYISYVDSVKYFRPEIKTKDGESLRTFVYYEILIGYLQYCKERGFISCNIWSCPPTNGGGYIFYCHPKIQKTPGTIKLREWYLKLLQKASKEEIVFDPTNLHEQFFVSHGECKAKVTAAHLPYFDGDYWPAKAECILKQLHEEEKRGKKRKKRKLYKASKKGALKVAGQTVFPCKSSKDVVLLKKLGGAIARKKEDLIMVHLQHACSRCCLLMDSGRRWVCNQCKNFHLCDKCHDAEKLLEARDMHPINSMENHVLSPVTINDMHSYTEDKNEILESGFFETNVEFWNFCRANNYQFDTLRRAKYSSMMILYHLHNPTPPIFLVTCVVCKREVEHGKGWRCQACPDFDVCNVCYNQPGSSTHSHKLKNQAFLADIDTQDQDARLERDLKLKKWLELLVHASKCFSQHQQNPNCRIMKQLLRHIRLCKSRFSGGCPCCKRMSYLLQVHARDCKDSSCWVPRCKDSKEELKRLQENADFRNSSMDMKRERAVEVAGSY